MDAGLVLDTVYSSDDFRLYCHKVLPCAKRTPHDWASCPFAHPGEKAKRRNIRTHYYSADMCAAVVKGEECKMGSSCPSSHSVFESFLHPQKYRTMMCKDRDKCSRPVCFFAHSADELRQPTDIRPLPEQQPQLHHHLQAGMGPPGPLRASGSSSEAAIAAALAAAEGRMPSPAAAAQPGAWHLQMQVASLADQLARATSNTSVISSTVSAGSGPDSPSPINSAAAAAAAAGGNVQHLLNHLIQDANSARQQLHAAQQQLQAMAGGGAACMPLQGGGGYAAQIGAHGAAGSMLPVRQLSLTQQAAASAGMPKASVGSCYGGGAFGGYNTLAMECTEGLSNASMDLTALEPSACSSASLSELSATLPLLTHEQMAQLHGANAAGGPSDSVLMRSGSSMSSSGAAPMHWGQQLAAAAQGAPVVGVPSRLGLHQFARGPGAHTMQQQQQYGVSAAKWQQQQHLAGQGGMMVQVPGGYAMSHPQMHHQQQQQGLPGQFGYSQGMPPVATQAATAPSGAPLYFMQ